MAPTDIAVYIPAAIKGFADSEDAMKARMTGALLIVLAGSFAGYAQNKCETFQEAARRGTPVNRIVLSDLPLMPLASVVERSDLIVKGVAQRVGTAISEDGCSLHTDSVIMPEAVYFGQTRNPSQPGAPLIVRQLGGETTIDGVKVTQNTKMRALDPGERVLLFLTGPDESGRHRIVGEIVGAFAIQNGQARAITSARERHFAEFSELPTEDLIAEVRRLIRR